MRVRMRVGGSSGLRVVTHTFRDRGVWGDKSDIELR